MYYFIVADDFNKCFPRMLNTGLYLQQDPPCRPSTALEMTADQSQRHPLSQSSLVELNWEEKKENVHTLYCFGFFFFFKKGIPNYVKCPELVWTFPPCLKKCLPWWSCWSSCCELIRVTSPVVIGQKASCKGCQVITKHTDMHHSLTHAIILLNQLEGKM